MVEGIRTNELNENFNIQVAGFRSQITDFKQLMHDLSKFNSKCTIQLMDAEGIAGKYHAEHATIHAIKVFSRKENISKDLGLEICVRASGQRQISQALRMLGLKNGDMKVCAVAVGCEKDIMENLADILGQRDDMILMADDDKLKDIYGISDIEAETAGSVSKLLMERTALLILET
jgi:KEOPS complex subunit Cgi121